MMTDRLLWPERTDEQRVLRYPFVDDASLVNVDGIVINPSLFNDASIHPVGGAVGAYLGKIEVEGLATTFSIYDPTNGITCSGTYTSSNPPTRPGLIRLLDVYGRPAGVLVSTADNLNALNGAYGDGVYEFTQAQTEFVASCVTPVPNHCVRGLLLADGTAVGGNVWLVGEKGVVLSLDGGKIRVDVVGDPYAGAKQCAEDGQPMPDFCGIRTINDIAPDSNGDFKITVGGNEARDAALRIEQSGSAVKIKLVGMSEL